MKSFKSKKSKLLLACLSVVLIVSILCVTLAGCKKPYAEDTPIGVYFVGDFQKNLSANEIAAITKEGETIVKISDALAQANIDYSADPLKAAAAIYAVAVTNYNNVTQTGYYVLTDANVNARRVSAVANNDISVGIRSTFSAFEGSKGNFSQTVSGVTKLEGLGPLGDQVRGAFGYNIQSFSNASFSASRQGDNGGAQFPSEAIDPDNIYKYILGAYNESLTNTRKGKKLNITPANEKEEERALPEYEPAAGAQYPSDSTLAGKNLPDFNKNRKAWEPLNRLPLRSWDGDKIVENSAVIEGTRYSYGTYGAGFAVYDFSRPEYLSSDTTVTYNSALDLYTINVAVLDDYVNQACEFAAGDLIKDTQNYIWLKNAKFTKLSCKIEVYGSGLIKSMQKIDELSTDEKCELKVVPATCGGGGSTSNTATMAFSYSNNDTDAEKLAALYWPELGTNAPFENKGKSTSLKLDLSSYPTFGTYQPVVNLDLVEQFENIFAKK